MLADLDLLLTAVFATADDLLPERAKNARRSVTDAEVVTLAVAQAVMDIASDREFLAVARRQLGALFPKLPGQPGYWKRRTRLADTIEWLIGVFAHQSPGYWDNVVLAFAPHDQRSVEVYWRGAWLCTAHPHDALTRAEQERILAERRAYAGELRRRQRRAHRAARTRLAPATSEQPAPAEVTRLPERALASRERGTRREEALRSAARTDLLLGAGPPRAKR